MSFWSPLFIVLLIVCPSSLSLQSDPLSSSSDHCQSLHSPHCSDNLMSTSSNNKMRAVLVKDAGASADSLYLSDQVDIPVPKQDEVLIRVKATAINRADIHQRKGAYPPPAGASTILGLECSGEIVSTPDPSKFAIGDRVMALLPGGGYAEYTTAPIGSVMKLPSYMSFEEGASIPEAFLTAYQLVREVGKINKNDVVLIHAAAAGVGTSAIQLVSLFGGVSIATAGKNEKIEFCKKLGASFGVNYKESDITASVKKWLSEQNKQGVNLVLDPVGASYTQSNFDLLTVDGRWVLYATMGGGEVPNFPLRNILMKRIQITGTTLRTRSNEYKANLVNNFINDTQQAFDNRTLKPIIDSVLPITEIVSAHKRMEADLNIGKIVLTF